jgi:predicted GIY-YIG superfamily endonuclease
MSENPLEKKFFVYFLALDLESGQHVSGQQTYIGATVDLDHRLRQHNKEIKGGAHATSAQVVRGLQWKRICHVRGFPTWQAALQFEWRWKQLSRKQSAHKLPIDRRMDALQMLLSLDRATSKAVPYAEWATQPEVVMS